MANLDTLLAIEKEGGGNLANLLAVERESTPLGQATRMAGVVGTGLVEGVANLLGLTIDLTSLGLRELGVELRDVQFGGSQSIKQGLEAMGMPRVEAETTAERIVQRIAEEIGASVIPAAVPLRLAQKGVKATSALGRAFVEPAARAPGAFAATEAGLATSSGAGAAVAQEIAPGSAGAEITGQLVGGFGPPAVTSAATGAAKAIARRFVPGMRDAAVSERATDAVANTLQRATGDVDRAVSRIGEAEKAATEFPGLQPTTAQATGEPGIIGIEQRTAGQSPPLTARMGEAQTRSNQALRTALDRIPPSDLVSAETVERSIRRRVNKLLGALDERIATARTATQDARSKAGGMFTKQQANLVTRGELMGAAEEFRTQARALSDAVDPEGTARFATKRIRDSVRELRQGKPKIEASEDTPAVMADVARLQSVEPFTELRALRTRIIRETRQEEVRPVANRNKVRKLNAILEATERTLDDVATSAEFPEVAARYSTFRQFFNEGASRLRQGTVGRVLRPGRITGEARVPESETIAAFFGPGKGARDRAEDFVAAVGNNPRAMGSVRDFATRDMIEFATDASGNIVARRLSMWLQSRSEALAVFPEIRRDLNTVFKAQKRVEALGARRERTVEIVEKSAAELVLGRDPGTAIAAMLRAKNPAKEAAALMRFGRRDPDAVRGLRRALWDEMLARINAPEFDLTGSPLLKPEAMRTFIDRNGKVFTALGYKPDDMARLREIARQSEIVGRTTPPGRIAPSRRALGKAHFHPQPAFEPRLCRCPRRGERTVHCRRGRDQGD